ncbi:exonuclease SbcC [Achromobacter ruhlandii]|nr:exonuclease SbcC [Achromobacter ruhlandii]
MQRGGAIDRQVAQAERGIGAQDQCAAAQPRAAGVGVGAVERQRAGARLVQVTGAAGGARQCQVVGALDAQAVNAERDRIAQRQGLRAGDGAAVGGQRAAAEGARVVEIDQAAIQRGLRRHQWAADVPGAAVDDQVVEVDVGGGTGGAAAADAAGARVLQHQRVVAAQAAVDQAQRREIQCHARAESVQAGAHADAGGAALADGRAGHRGEGVGAVDPHAYAAVDGAGIGEGVAGNGAAQADAAVDDGAGRVGHGDRRAAIGDEHGAAQQRGQVGQQARTDLDEVGIGDVDGAGGVTHGHQRGAAHAGQERQAQHGQAGAAQQPAVVDDHRTAVGGVAQLSAGRAQAEQSAQPQARVDGALVGQAGVLAAQGDRRADDGGRGLPAGGDQHRGAVHTAVDGVDVGNREQYDGVVAQDRCAGGGTRQRGGNRGQQQNQCLPRVVEGKGRKAMPVARFHLSSRNTMGLSWSTGSPICPVPGKGDCCTSGSASGGGFIGCRF